MLLAALNEEHGIGPTIKDLKQYLVNPAILVIDGRSVDRTVKIAQRFDIAVLRQQGTGKGNAIAQGIRHTSFSGDYAVIIDADFTYPAEFIPHLVEVLDSRPEVGMVCGSRFNDEYVMSDMKSMFFIGNRILSFTHNLLNGVKLNDPLSGLRVVRWNLLRNWCPNSLGFDMEVELNHFVEKQGYSIVEVPIRFRPRLGKKKLDVFDGLTILKRIILESISRRGK